VNGIPVLRVDRGGQITYHGPGQLVAYTLFDLRRSRVAIRAMVRSIEDAVIEWLASLGIAAYGKPSAPGVYVAGAKLAAVGLRVKRHCSYHGLAVNVAMDLSPYRGINPCGYEGLAVTDLRTLSGSAELARFRADFEPSLLARLAPSY
jgi:lipoyl(octanoyl) transferase